MPRVTSTLQRRQPPPPAPLTLQARWAGAVGEHVQSLAWSPDGTLLAAASIAGPITLFEGATGVPEVRLPGHGFGTTAVGWSASGAHLASTGQDGKVRLWDAEAGTERAALPGGAAWIERLAWCPVTDILATAGGKSLRFWTGDGTLLREYTDHASTIADVAWKPKTQQLVAAAYGGITFFDPSQEEKQARFGWQGSTLVVAWSPDGKFIATGDQDSTVHFWFSKTGKDLQMWGFATKVRELSWDPTSRWLATGGSPEVCVWDCSGKGPEGRRPRQLKGHEQLISALAYHPSGPWLVSGGQDGYVMIWHPERTNQPLEAYDLEAPIAQIVWSQDGRTFAVGTEAGEIAVFAVA